MIGTFEMKTYLISYVGVAYLRRAEILIMNF